MDDLLIIFWQAGMFSILFAVAEIMNAWLNVPAEATRKVVHVGSGLLTLLFPVFFRQLWQVGVLCAVFFIVLLISQQLGMLKSINGIRRKSRGSILFPAIVLGVFGFYLFSKNLPGAHFGAYYYFAAPMLIMTLCDPAAAFAGTLYHRRHRDAPAGKTFTGSLTFFIIATIVAFTLTYWFIRTPVTPILPIGLSLALGIITTLSERYSTNGWDNFTIPLSAAGCIYLADHLFGL